MGLYTSRFKKQQQPTQPKLVETASGGSLLDKMGNVIDKYTGYLPQEQKQYDVTDPNNVMGTVKNNTLPRTPVAQPDLQQTPPVVQPELQQNQPQPPTIEKPRPKTVDELPDQEVQDTLSKKGYASMVDKETGKKRYFVDNSTAKIDGKTWDEMNTFEKFVVGGSVSEQYGESLVGNTALGAASMALKAGGFMGRLLDKTTGTEFIMDKLGVDKTAGQQLMDFANEIDKYKDKEFGTFSYKPEDVTAKNIPKLFTNPEWLLNSVSSAITSGLAASVGGVPLLFTIEGGSLLSERRQQALLKGAKEESNAEVLYSAGMGLFNAWLENLSFKVMSGNQKIPFSEKLISKISNNIAKNVVSWGTKVATEMGEEFVQGGLPVLVAEAMFKDRGSLIEGAKDAFNVGMSGAISAIPGAGLLSAAGVSAENRQQSAQQSLEKIAPGETFSEQQYEGDVAKLDSQKETVYKERVQNIKNKFLSETKQSIEGLGYDKMFQNGKIIQKYVDSRAFDIGSKISDVFGEEIGNKVAETLKQGEYYSPKQFINTVEETLLKNVPDSEKGMVQAAIEMSNETLLTPDGREISMTTPSSVDQEAFKVNGDQEVNSALDIVSKEGKIALKEIATKPTKVEYDGFVDSDFGNDAKSKAALKAVQEGKQKPIIVALENGKLKVVDGNHTLWAYKELGYNEIPIILSEADLTESKLVETQTNERLAESSLKNIEELKAQKEKVGLESQLKTAIAGKEASGTVRIIPEKDLKYLYKEAQKQGVDKELAQAMSKPLDEEQLNRMSSAQKELVATILDSASVADNVTEGVMIENIKALGQTPSVSVNTEVGKGEPIVKTEQKAEITPKPASPIDTISSKISELEAKPEELRKQQVATTREAMRLKVEKLLEKDAETFVDVSGGKNKAAAFKLSVKKLPNGKYGYAITFNTPKTSKVVNYKPKFASREKAMQMGIQSSIRLVEEARRAGVPKKGLAKIAEALKVANKKLGKKALTKKKVLKVAKEVQKKESLKQKAEKMGVGVEVLEEQIKYKEAIKLGYKPIPYEKDIEYALEFLENKNEEKKQKELAKETPDVGKDVTIKGLPGVYYKKEGDYYVVLDDQMDIVYARERTLSKAISQAKKNVELTMNQIKAKVPQSASSLASVGAFSDIESYDKYISRFNHVQLPELVKLVKEISNKTPIIKKLRIGRQGEFRPANKLIALSPNLFKNDSQANKTLAHEIGHLVDYLPEDTMTRGNILGSILSLRKFLKHTFTDENGTIKRNEIRDELWKLSTLWRPLGEKPSDSYLKYRKSPRELYADAISVLLNDPALLETEAPAFYTAFFDNLDKKPDVKEAFFNTWDLISKGEAEVISQREKDLREMFNKGEDLYKIKREERQKATTDWKLAMKIEFNDKNQAMIDRVKKAQKEGAIISDDANPIYMLKEFNYLAGEIKNFMERNIVPIQNTLKDIDLTSADLGEMLFLKRIISGDRSEVANPQGFTKVEAEKQLAYLEETIGKEKFDLLEIQGSKFQDAIQEVLTTAEEAELYGDELLDKMKANPNYAFFQVLEYLDLNVPASIKRQVGTFADIANPYTSTIMKMTSILRAAEANKVRLSVRDFLQKNGTPEEFVTADKRWTGKYWKVVPPKDLEKQGLLTVMEKGKVNGYYVDPYIAAIFEKNTTGMSKSALRVLNGMKFINNPSRKLVINYNPAFQVRNLLRDFFRTWKNLSLKGNNISLWEVATRYYEAVTPALDRALGVENPLISEMERNKILSITYQDLSYGATEIDEQIDYVLAKSGVFATKEKSPNKILKPFIKFLDIMETAGNFIETLPKVAGYKALEGKLPPKELGEFIRTKVGSPDFLTRGNNKYYNEVFMFSNAIKEAWKADYDIATNPTTRTGFWVKTVQASIVPRMLFLAAALGLFGEPLKKLLDKIPEYDKTNYLPIPIGTDEKGKTVYIPIIQDETSRFISGILWKTGMAIGKDEPIDKSLLTLFDYSLGQTPSLSPIIDTVAAVSQYAVGNNPYDFFRGRSVIPDEEFAAGTKYSLVPFVKWTLQNLGANTILSLNVYSQSPVSKSWQEKALSIPLAGNFLKAFFRVSDYGEVEEARKIQERIVTEDSARRLEWKKAINKGVEEFTENPTQSNKKKIQDKLLKDLLGEEGTKQQANYIKKKFQLGLLKSTNDVKVKVFTSATTNKAKLEILSNYKEDMGKGEYKALLDFLLEEKLISKNVYDEAN